MNKKIIKYIIIVLIIMSVAIIFNIKNNNVKASYTNKKSMYMWETDNIDFFQYDDIIKKLDINKIYAYVGTNNLNTRIGYEQELLLSYNKSNNIDTFLVYDENYEDQQVNLNRIKEFIDEINNYNNNSKYKITGLAIDSEFHTLDSYRNSTTEEQIETFNNYVNTMKDAYSYAKNYNLSFVVCIPVWLDKLDINLLDSLIVDGCDYVQLMNYTKNNMVESIKEEVEIAKKYNKKIENIAELQRPGNHGVTDEISFYNDGINSCNNKFIEIDNYYNYNLLTFSYHYYKPLVELNSVNTDEIYNIEFKLKNEQGQGIDLTRVILKENQNELYPIYIFNSTTNEFIAYFFGLKYGNVYELVTDDINYELLDKKEITFENDGEKTKTDEIVCKLKITTITQDNEEVKEELNEIVDKPQIQEVLEDSNVITEDVDKQITQEEVKGYADEIVINNAQNILYKIESNNDYNNTEDSNIKIDSYSNEKKEEKKNTNKVKKIQTDSDKKEEKLEQQSDYKLSLIVVICLISISIFIIIKNIINNKF